MSDQQTHRAILWHIFNMGLNHDAVKANDTIEKLVAQYGDNAENEVATLDQNVLPVKRFTWDVNAVSTGGIKIRLIKVIRDVTGLGLFEAKTIADNGNFLSIDATKFGYACIGNNYNRLRPIVEFLKLHNIPFDISIK